MIHEKLPIVLPSRSGKLCCTCARLLSEIPRYGEDEKQLSVDDRTVRCCGRVICGVCIRDNHRFAFYCPYCRDKDEPTPHDSNIERKCIKITDTSNYSQAVHASPPLLETVSLHPTRPKPNAPKTTASISAALCPVTAAAPTTMPGPVPSPGNNTHEDQTQTQIQRLQQPCHRLRPHDTLHSISLLYSVPLAALRQVNQLSPTGLDDNLLCVRYVALLPPSAILSSDAYHDDSEDEKAELQRVRREALRLFVRMTGERDERVATMYLTLADWNAAAAAKRASLVYTTAQQGERGKMVVLAEIVLAVKHEFQHSAVKRKSTRLMPRSGRIRETRGQEGHQENNRPGKNMDARTIPLVVSSDTSTPIVSPNREDYPEVVPATAPVWISPVESQHAGANEERWPKYLVQADPTQKLVVWPGTSSANTPDLSSPSDNTANSCPLSHISGHDPSSSPRMSAPMLSPDSGIEAGTELVSPSLASDKQECLNTQSPVESDLASPTEKRILGLKRRPFYFLLFIFLFLAVVAIAAGICVALLLNRKMPGAHSGNVPSSTTGQAVESTSNAKTTAISRETPTNAQPSPAVPTTINTPLPVGNHDFNFQGWESSNFMGRNTPALKQLGFYYFEFQVNSYLWAPGAMRCCHTLCNGVDPVGWYCDARIQPFSSSAITHIHIWCDGKNDDHKSQCVDPSQQSSGP